MKCTKLIMLCDYGIDDAVATTYILDRASQFESIDILPVAGNFPLSIAFNNAKRILKQYQHLNNVKLIDTSEIPQRFEYLYNIHGADGMGDVLENENDIEFPCIPYGEWIKNISNDATVLSLGPCTVTLDILRKTDSLKLIMMAGNILQKPNYNEYEFNHGIDVQAFKECIKFPHVSATMDSCHNTYFDFYNIKTQGKSLFNEFVKSSIALSKERNEKTGYIYDFVAAYYLLNPTDFEVLATKDAFGNTVSVLNYTGTGLKL